MPQKFDVLSTLATLYVRRGIGPAKLFNRGILPPSAVPRRLLADLLIRKTGDRFGRNREHHIVDTSQLPKLAQESKTSSKYIEGGQCG